LAAALAATLGLAAGFAFFTATFFLAAAFGLLAGLDFATVAFFAIRRTPLRMKESATTVTAQLVL
jgi:hypothetical protein